ncbi:MAG: sigma-70 region 4 domain-containing protein [Nanoarchaeota archaeon]|nr:sigma-70 region 4 domain-containing protein [Nanoarchaeota archaeon]MBU1027526.1 sigma-70 region 4 domain-containing protein [Nanoarchaeota archaeon]
MINKIIQLEQRKKEIIEKIRTVAKVKRRIINYTKKLISDFNSKKITKEEYQEKLKKDFKQKYPQEWLDYYTKHITIYEKHLEECEKAISREKRKSIIKKIILPLISIALISMGLFLYSYLQERAPALAPPTIETYTETLGVTINENITYTWILDNFGTLQSVKLSGLIIEQGNAKVYLEDNSENEFLIFDSLNIGILYSPDENITQNTTQPTNQTIPQTNISNQTLSPNQTTNITQPTNQTTLTPEKITIPENITQEIPINETNITKKIIPINITLNFSDICEETCDLSEFNLNQTSYNLKIEITNSELYLDTITYEIITQEITLPPENITIPENITEEPLSTPLKETGEKATWWNSFYQYRKQLRITNNQASTLVAGYSVYFVIDTTGPDFLDNGDDLRIVWDSGTGLIELDRVNETIFDSTTTQIWFKSQQNIPASSYDENYYLYYGNNAAANPPNNKKNVYLWFDDFNRVNKPDITTESDYSIKTNGGTWSIENNQLKNIGATGDPNKLFITALGSSVLPVEMLTKINVNTWVANNDLGRIGLSQDMISTGAGYCSLFHNDQSSLDLLNDLLSWGTLGTYSWLTNTWYNMRFKVIDPSTRNGQIKVWQSGTAEPGSWTIDGNFGTGAAKTNGYVGFAGSRQADITYFDDIQIRYIVAQEPTLTIFDVQNTPPSIPLDMECNGVSGPGSCNIEVNTGVLLEATGSTDEDLDLITYYLEAYLDSGGTCANNGACDLCGNSAQCSDCSGAGCSWISEEDSSTLIHFTGFETDATAPWDGWVNAGTDCLRSLQSAVNDNGILGGTYSLEVQDNTFTSYTAQTFDLSSPCEGSTCDSINLSVYLRPSSYDNTREGFDIWCDHGTLNAVRIAHWIEDGDNCVIIGGIDVCEDVWTKVEFDLISLGCTIDSAIEIRFTSQDFTSGGNNDQVYIDGINITGHKSGELPGCSGTLDCSSLNQVNCQSCNQCDWQTSKQWVEIGSHTESSSFNWDTSLLPEQTNVNLRARAIDLTGSNTYSNYFTKNPTSPYLEINHGANDPPIITITSVDTNNQVDLIPASTTPVEIIFDVTDPNGYTDIDDSSVSISYDYDLGGEVTRNNFNCPAPTNNGLNTKTFTCTVDMEYYDAAGYWTATIDISDFSGPSTGQDTHQFTVNFLRAISLNPGTITFPPIFPGQTNINSAQNTNIINEGNFEIPEDSKLQITSQALIGQSNPLENISGNNFRVVEESIGNPCVLGTQLSETIPIDISGITLSRLPPGSYVNISYCLTSVPSISSQDYSTTGYNAWSIDIVVLLVAVIPARRKKKKKILDENFLNFLDENLKDLLIFVKQNKIKSKLQNIEIPLSIFKQGLSPAEVVCKYLKENKKLKFSEIAIALNRDQRTIWINYRNSSNKLKEKIKIEKSVLIPINIFKNKLSILEAIVKYLKDLGLKNQDIAKLLGKNPNNIWTIYSRAIKK